MISRTHRSLLSALLLVVPVVLAAPAARGGHLTGPAATYTDDADFDEGTSINLVHSTAGQLQLRDAVVPFGFIWVAVSTKGTVVKIDTRSGAVVGEYLSSPTGMGRDPSRTTVDKNGNVWVANRAEFGYVPSPRGLLKTGSAGSVVHIGLEENGQCQDRNGNGVIDTSGGYGDVRAWTNAGSADTFGGVSTAQDECVIHYTRVNSTGTRHVSVAADNNVWVGGFGERNFDLVSWTTGAIIRAEPSANCGGYGGLIDKNGVIWSARPLLRWDTALPLTAGNYTCYSHDSYGLGIDTQGNVWESALCCNVIRKFAPSGALSGTFTHGASYAQGVVVDRNDHVWVAHSLLGGATVGHLDDTGKWLGNVAVGSGPTGVSVDAAGMVWATNYYSRSASRIDPALNGSIGFADLETRDLGGNPYNYSDMTGSVLIGPAATGRWTIVHDGGAPGARWTTVSWNADVPGDGSLTVTAATSDDSAVFPSAQQVTNGGQLSVPDGRYLMVNVSFRRAGSGASPILYDLTIGRFATILTANPAVALVRYPGGPTVFFPDLSARLTDAPGNPIAGRTVEFYATDVITGTRALVCSAATDAGGLAACGGVVEEVAAVRGLGYEAVFAGDVLYLPSSDEAPVIVVQGDLP